MLKSENLHDQEVNTEISLKNINFRNPLMTASGCSGFGEELTEVADFDFSMLGAFVCKSVSVEPIEGNLPPRIAETPSGMINSIGLQNKGIRHFLEEIKPSLERIAQQTKVIASIFGVKISDFGLLAKKLADENWLSALEINVSCPNHEKGGLAFGADETALTAIITEVKKIVLNSTNPEMLIIAKLTPNVPNIADFAEIAVQAGADALTISNTYLGMSVDWCKRKTVLARGFGGLSGPAVKPMTLHKIFEVRKRLPAVPIIASGGISSADDVLESMVTGASAVQIGAAFFRNPLIFQQILADLQCKLKAQNIDKISDLIGTLKI